MSGRPVHLLAAAAFVATASLASISTASAGCYSCGSYSYAAPVAYYSAPVVYGYSYAAPVSYAAPCSPCGGYGYGYGYAAPSPMYVVNQGPAYTAPVLGYAEPTPAPAVSYGYGYGYGSGYGSAYPLYSEGGIRWHRRHWGYRGHGYRGYGYRGFGYRAYGARNWGYGYRGFGAQRYRYGAVAPRLRYGMRTPMINRPIIGPGGFYRGPRHGMPGFARPMHHAAGVVPHRMPGAVMPRGPMPMKKKMP
jgi:hypothetical protein